MYLSFWYESAKIYRMCPRCFSDGTRKTQAEKIPVEKSPVEKNPRWRKPQQVKTPIEKSPISRKEMTNWHHSTVKWQSKLKNKIALYLNCNQYSTQFLQLGFVLRSLAKSKQKRLQKWPCSKCIFDNDLLYLDQSMVNGNRYTPMNIPQ